ncbi:hypothetical protein [Actinokineospora diospyrosa]|uniref:Ig-like domain-containing protein n=1 Tax=Actinokineospora diospyrosa TaxID=103728 RepID=A0ABT1I4W0_9PSEU|nr:hypothetical protein [Actinokineospora diospyrosa]MCP2267648.1 hypothetical protein [Actinokineospora diospyrosa]
MKKLLVIAATAAAALGLAAPPAGAVTSAAVWCESAYTYYTCSVGHDAIAPYTIRWTVNGSPAPSFDNAENTPLTRCSVRVLLDIGVTVTDSTGSRSATTRSRCSSGPWP